jgi:folate-binding protein YgfZ
MGIVKQIGSKSVVWEAKSFPLDYHASLASGGWFDLAHWDCVSISGPDTWDYLNRMSTLNFKHFTVGNVAPGAFLTGKSIPIVWGYFLRVSEAQALYLVPPEQGAVAAEHLEKFHFQETLEITEVSREWSALGIWQSGGATLEAPWAPGQKLTQALPHTPPQGSLGAAGVAQFSTVHGGWAWRDPLRPSLVWWLGEALQHRDRCAQVESSGLPQLGYRLFEFYRIDAGIVCVGRETGEKTLALQAGLDASISDQKGCYPGQEVVERIRTYGRVNAKLSRVELTGGIPAVLPVDLADSQGKPVGSLVAAEVLPDDPSRAYGIAYISCSFLDLPVPPALSLASGSGEEPSQATLQGKLQVSLRLSPRV